VIEIVSDLQAVGELEILPTGSPSGGQAYRIPTGELTSPRDFIPSEVSSADVVNSVHPNLYESRYCKNDSTEEEVWLTPDEAIRLGLTRGVVCIGRQPGSYCRRNKVILPSVSS
jgi:hypothetical protein